MPFVDSKGILHFYGASEATIWTRYFRGDRWDGYTLEEKLVIFRRLMDRFNGVDRTPTKPTTPAPTPEIEEIEEEWDDHLDDKDTEIGETVIVDATIIDPDGNEEEVAPTIVKEDGSEDTIFGPTVDVTPIQEAIIDKHTFILNLNRMFKL